MHLLSKASLVTATCFPLVFAQLDMGVQIKADVFSGTQTCEQLSLNSYDDQTGLQLYKDANKQYQLSISHETSTNRALNTFSSTTQIRSERVTLYLNSSEHLFFTPVGTGNFSSDLEVARVNLDYYQVTRILGSANDLRVRFETANTANEFIVNHQVIRSLAKGFGLFCLEKVSNLSSEATTLITRARP